MTEEEWLGCDDAGLMLKHLRGKGSERKLRLFMVACCRRIWHSLNPTEGRSVVEFAERSADEQDGVGAVENFRNEIDWSQPGVAKYVLYADVFGAAELVQGEVVRSLVEEGESAAVKRALSEEGETAEEARQAGLRAYHDAGIRVRRDERRNHSCLLHCIVGNPFRPISINANWLTATVSNLATIAYEERALPSGKLNPGRLAILGDALEDSGCDNQEILSHLRSTEPHVRGCWALDLLLGKK